ncbi:MAG: hypothetical protein ACE5PM_01950 [Candidatus Hydrothermarchaeales archaeon]
MDIAPGDFAIASGHSPAGLLLLVSAKTGAVPTATNASPKTNSTTKTIADLFIHAHLLFFNFLHIEIEA